ncbi:MAG: fatty acid biosynthesis transcriptional regulator, partial [Bacilli bacterium]|nr:fatty acid biosynthesis transcriptional regulator [Bacilli bacterium]
VIALDMAEVIGEILEMVPETSGSSLLEIGAEHVFQRTQIARGHHIFAQANSLAVAMIPFDVVLTRSAEVKYLRPVRLGERLYCKGNVIHKEDGRYMVKVKTKAGLATVFEGRFEVVRAPQSVADHKLGGLKREISR